MKGRSTGCRRAHAVAAEVRLYDHLFAVEDPSDAPEGGDFTTHLNPNSLEVARATRSVEPSLADAEPRQRASSSSAWATSRRP